MTGFFGPSLSKLLLDRIGEAVNDEEQSHRELASVVEEMFVASGSNPNPELMGRYIQCMQSFDQMRQRIEFLANTTKLLVEHPTDDLQKLLVPIGESAPIREDGDWLLTTLEGHCALER